MAVELEMARTPLIPAGALARAKNVSPPTIDAVAERVGIEAARSGSGRKLYSFEQASRIAVELAKKAG